MNAFKDLENSFQKSKKLIVPNVGIGTTNPTAALHIVPTTNGDGITLQGTSGSYSPGFNLQDGATYRGGLGLVERTSDWSSSADIGDIVLRAGTGKLHMMTGVGAASMTIASGDVGIGVTSPTSKLQVAGNITPDTTASKNLGSSSLRWQSIYLSSAPDVSSDARLKKEVQDSDLGLEFINSLRPVSWIWKDQSQGTTQHYGVIAQEAESAIAKAKGKDSRNVIVNHDEKTDSYSVRYTELISPLIKAIQELYNDLLSVKTEVVQLKAENAELRAKVQKTEQENTAIKAYLCEKDPKAAICK